MANEHWNLIDTPLTAGEEDLLGISKYLDGLVNFLQGAQMPTTLAIQGEWGSGKTSLMNQLRYQLCTSTRENKEKKPYYGVWINTWQYSLLRNDQDIIIHVIEGITSEVIKIVKSKNSFLANEALHKLGACFRSVAKIGAHAAATAVGISGNAVDELLNQQSSSSDPFVFRESFETSIKNCLQADRENNVNTRGFLFFVDDLDRIDPQLAVKILEIVKNLFEVENCIFILAIDYEVVVKGLAPKFGKMTEENEREYRSFFDKIVQLPFKMPIETYNIEEYLASSLQKIQFFTKQDIDSKIKISTKDNDASENIQIEANVSEIARDLVTYSAGTNPRSIKRLLNTLSLIRIMYAGDMKNDNTPDKKLIFLGLICLQISYPLIYRLLVYNPEFYEWDDAFAQERRLKQIDDDTAKEISNLDDFSEDWEKVLLRACIGNPFLMKKQFYISKLMNCIKNIVLFDKGTELGELIRYYLGVASITSVTEDSTPTIKENTHTEEEQIGVASEKIQNIYHILKDKILATCEATPVPKQKYISFRVFGTKKVFCDAVIYKGKLRVFFNVKTGELVDEKGITLDMSKVGHYGNGDYAVDVKSEDILDDVVGFAKQAYDIKRKLID